MCSGTRKLEIPQDSERRIFGINLRLCAQNTFGTVGAVLFSRMPSGTIFPVLAERSAIPAWPLVTAKARVFPIVPARTRILTIVLAFVVLTLVSRAIPVIPAPFAVRPVRIAVVRGGILRLRGLGFVKGLAIPIAWRTRPATVLSADTWRRTKTKTRKLGLFRFFGGIFRRSL